MKKFHIELTDDEKALVDTIDLTRVTPESSRRACGK